VDINELEFSGQIVARDPRGHDDEQAQKGTCDARRPSRTNIAGISRVSGMARNRSSTFRCPFRV